MAFFMFRINQWVWVDFDENRLNEVLNWVEETVDDIDSEFDFPPITQESNDFNFFCQNFCDFRHSCKYGQVYCGGDLNESTLRENY